MIISGSVGSGGANRNQDVRLVQRLLNDARSAAGGPLLKVNGLVDSETNAAIEQYQRQRGLPASGLIEQSSPTLRRLVHDFLNSLAAGIVHPSLPQGAASVTEAD